MSNSNQSNTSSKSIGAGLLVAFTASLCCITPVFATLAGIGGVASSFSWMEPFRPYLIGLTVLVLGFAWYQKLRPRTQEEIDCACEEDEKPSFWQNAKGKTFCYHLHEEEGAVFCPPSANLRQFLATFRQNFSDMFQNMHLQ